MLDPVEQPAGAWPGRAGHRVPRGGCRRGLAEPRCTTRPTALCVAAERGALEALEGSCRTAIGAHARLDGGELKLLVEALTADGRTRWRRDAAAPASTSPQEAYALGAELGRSIRAEAGEALIVAP